METYKLIRTLNGHTKQVNSICLDPTGQFLASCSSDLTIKVWDVSSFVCLKSMSGHDDVISGIVFLPSGDQICSCSKDSSLKLWDRQSGYCVATLNHEDDLVDPKRGGGGGDIKERLNSNHNESKKMKNSCWIRCLDVSICGEWLASGDDNMVHVYRLAKQGGLDHKSNEWTHKFELRHHQHHIQTLAFNKPSQPQPSSSLSSLSRIKSSGEGSAVAGVESDDSSGGGRGLMLASGGRDSLICLWDVYHGTLSFVLNYHHNWINDLCFHPDGKHILSCSDDKTIRIGDLSKRRCLRTIPDAHDCFVTSISLSESFLKLISSGSTDKTIKVWDCN